MPQPIPRTAVTLGVGLALCATLAACGGGESDKAAAPTKTETTAPPPETPTFDKAATQKTVESQFTEYNEAVIKMFSMPAESRKDFIKPYLSRHYIDIILDEELAGLNEDDEIQIDPGNLTLLTYAKIRLFFMSAKITRKHD